MANSSPTTNINLRLSTAQLNAIDDKRPSTVPRSHWIRGAILQRLEAEGCVIPGEPAPRRADTSPVRPPPRDIPAPNPLHQRPIIQKVR